MSIIPTMPKCQLCPFSLKIQIRANCDGEEEEVNFKDVELASQLNTKICQVTVAYKQMFCQTWPCLPIIAILTIWKLIRNFHQNRMFSFSAKLSANQKTSELGKAGWTEHGEDTFHSFETDLNRALKEEKWDSKTWFEAGNEVKWIFSCDKQLKKSRCHFVRPFVR